jgi:nucleotide-binding universal stress UspA family protein
MSNEWVQLLPLKRVLVATDGSKNAERAVDAACQIAKQSGAELTVLSVVMEPVPRVYAPVGVVVPSLDYSSYLEAAEVNAKKTVNDAAQRAEKDSIRVSVSVPRSKTSPADVILEEALKENVNLIVVGTRGLGGFERLLLGSVSRACVEHASCSVLVVR